MKAFSSNCLRNSFKPLLAGLLAASSLSGMPGEFAPGWPVPVGDLVFASPAIGPHGEVVIAAEIGSDPGPYDGAVYSLNPDGSVRWVFTGTTDWVDSSPTIDVDGSVYFGGWDGWLYALDGDTGGLKWKYEIGNVITASPAIGPDGNLYVGAHDGILYAFSPGGSLLWTFEAGQELGPISAGAVFNPAGNRLYFGTETGVLYCLSTVTGQEIWNFPIPLKFRNIQEIHAILAPPAVGPDGTVYFTCENGMVFGVPPDGSRLNYTYFSINPDPQNPVESLRSSPIIDAYDIVYVVGQDGYLMALGTDSQLSLMVQLWEIDVGDVFYCSPAMDEGRKIIIAGYAGSGTTGAATDFTCVNIATQEILWEQRVAGLNDSSPNIAPDGSIYIGAHDGRLYKLEGDSEMASTGWPRRQGNRRQTGWAGDLSYMEMVDYFPETTQWEEGWIDVPWFGWITDVGLPWISHPDHGLIYLEKSGSGSIEFYDPRLGEWVAAMEGYPNFLYLLESGAWLYHKPGSSVFSGRWFYDYTLQAWLEESSLLH